MSNVVSALEANPAGEIELTDAQLESVCGGWDGGDDGDGGFDGGHFAFFKKDKIVFFKKESIRAAEGGF